MSIRVKTNQNNLKVRVGQTDAVKVVASNASIGTVDHITNIGDVTMVGKDTNTLLMYDGTRYIHVTPRNIVDISDGTQDGAFDAGSF